MSESFLNGKITLHCGDMLAMLPTLAENSFDSCVTDPPYHLTSTNRGSTPGSVAACADVFKRVEAGGFMGKAWDGGDVAFQAEAWVQILRVLKPGAHLIAFGGTRTYHRMVCAIEDAGFEIRDQIGWVYGSGFPKSHDVSKAIDRAAGAKREVIPSGQPVKRMIPGADQNKVGWEKNNGREYVPGKRPPATDTARQWEGWGTALKPACEPIVVARKPLSEPTVAANVLKWGCGAINIDGCRIATTEATERANNGTALGLMNDDGWQPKAMVTAGSPLGRWPANIIHDGSEEVLAAFPDVAGAVSNGRKGKPGLYEDGLKPLPQHPGYADAGSAARFFYTAKADANDRLGSKHPTVKPLDLMQYLVRLVTPPKGLVLDCFAGTGTTAEAAFREGMCAVLIEREAEYQDDIRRRMALALSGPDERARETIKEQMKGKPFNAGPLFEVASE